MENLIWLLILTIIVLMFFYFYRKIHQLQRKNNDLKSFHQNEISQLILSHDNILHELKIKLENEKKNAIQFSLNASRNTIKGQMSEKFCPFQANFPYTPADCTFLGKPLDFIVFHNIEKYRDNNENINIDDVEIIFLEIKTGKASLTKVEKAIKHAVENKRVRFSTYRYNGILTDQTNTNQKSNHQNIDIQLTDENDIKPLNFEENDYIHRTDSNNQNILKCRERYQRTSYKWSAFEIDLLIEKFDQGHNLSELSLLFQRTPNGIASRLSKLGVDTHFDE